MDAAAIATASIAMQAGQTRDIMSAKMTKMAHEQQQAMANMILQLAEQAKQTMAAPPPGMGTRVDISA